MVDTCTFLTPPAYSFRHYTWGLFRFPSSSFPRTYPHKSQAAANPAPCFLAPSGRRSRSPGAAEPAAPVASVTSQPHRSHPGLAWPVERNTGGGSTPKHGVGSPPDHRPSSNHKSYRCVKKSSRSPTLPRCPCCTSAPDDVW
ncbi:uncharacterized protein BCR38DRAFT_111918 [Pseudomassariella vexata]|uniref:Uncharacterized protein n=1 Tax=Pseudomassariella vexata TaxID=1141098 RepID=A0A1Y2DC77_9PEZI|nr:uncharacterized protein BCR38DRAFT_111918 [Pseudomassariella vexata]ORY56872.1 hypothetical protein BCR38DRAFT_111918 [Pseudomassariella vexata]